MNASVSAPAGRQNKCLMKEIYFTFDDGPSDLTPYLLDILKNENIKASFFVTNQFERSDLLSRICEEGHLVGLHSYSHDFSSIYSSVDNFFHDLNRLEQLVYDNTGLKSEFLRFPGGTSNTRSRRYGGMIMPILLAEAKKRGYKVFDWNCENGDGTDPGNSYSEYKKAGIQSINGHDCAVFLSHCRPTDKESIKSIISIAKWCRTNGYALKRLDEYCGKGLTHLKLGSV